MRPQQLSRPQAARRIVGASRFDVQEVAAAPEEIRQGTCGCAGQPRSEGSASRSGHGPGGSAPAREARHPALDG
jgi:hypothetical protein